MKKQNPSPLIEDDTTAYFLLFIVLLIGLIAGQIIMYQSFKNNFLNIIENNHLQYDCSWEGWKDKVECQSLPQKEINYFNFTLNKTGKYILRSSLGNIIICYEDERYGLVCPI